MSWSIVMRTGEKPGTVSPSCVLSAAPQFTHEGMPLEIGHLLPTSAGPMNVVTSVTSAAQRQSNAIVGLFLANPFLNIDREAERLHAAGYRWIANLPTVDQQDAEFSHQLSDVSLDRAREFAALGRFKELGFNVAVVVSDPDAASEAVSIPPDLIFVIPKVADFAAGFPSTRQRGAVANAVVGALENQGWSGQVLCLGSKEEAEHDALWPDAVDGLILRPSPLD